MFKLKLNRTKLVKIKLVPVLIKFKTLLVH